MELEALIKHLLAELRNREAVILDNIESLKVGQKVQMCFTRSIQSLCLSCFVMKHNLSKVFRRQT